MKKILYVLGLAAWSTLSQAYAQLCTPNPDACVPDPVFGVCTSPENLNVGYVGFDFLHTMHLLAAKSVAAPPNQFGINTVYIRRIEVLRIENLPPGVNVRIVSSNPNDHAQGYHEPDAQGVFAPSVPGAQGARISRRPAAQDNHPTVGLYPCVVFYGVPQATTQITDSVTVVFNLFVNFSGDSGDGIDPGSFQPGFNPQSFRYPIVIREVAQMVVQPLAPVCANSQIQLNAVVLDNVGLPALPLEPLIRWYNLNTGENIGEGVSASAFVTETTTFRAEISDVSGNTYFGEVTVNVVPGVDVADISVTPSCPSTGQQSFAYAVPTGGTGNYSYFWSTLSGGSINDPTSPTQSGLAPGTYDLYIFDDSGSDCNSVDVQIVVPQPISLALSGQIQHPEPPECLGRFRVQASGGGTSGEYRYYLNGANSNSTGNFSNLTPGTYTVTAYAVENGTEQSCAATLSVSLNPCGNPVPPVFIIQLQKRPFTAGTGNGQIRARAAAGTPPYRWQLYQADGITPVGPPQNNVNPVRFQNLTVEPLGTSYVVRVTDAANQSAEITARLN